MEYETVPPPVRSVLYINGLSVPTIFKSKLLAEKPPEKNVSDSQIIPVAASVYLLPPQLIYAPPNKTTDGMVDGQSLGAPVMDVGLLLTDGSDDTEGTRLGVFDGAWLGAFVGGGPLAVTITTSMAETFI
jgi:hypothetical protein